MYPYQRVIAVDPGVSIGLAHITLADTIHTSFTWSACQTEHVDEAFEWVDERMTAGTTLVIEDYISSGHLTNAAKHTIKVLGFLQHSFEGGTSVELAVPQKRKPFVAKAVELLGVKHSEVPDSRNSVAALAHAIAKLRRLGVPNPVFG